MMSKDDPGGSSNPENLDFSGLQNNFSQQQAKITALKEMVRNSESKQGKNNQSAQEKVKNIAQRLTHLKTKATRSRQLSSASVERFDEHHISNILEEESDSSQSSATLNMSLPTLLHQRRSETPSASEKFNILRKSIEEKRQLMERRENQNKEIQQRVDQMRSDFESSQMSLEKSLEYGRSVGDLTLLTPLKGREFMSVADVSSANRVVPNFSVERMQFLEARVKQLETDIKITAAQTDSEQVKALQAQILDLQENLKEKECVIEARTQAVSLMSENMSLKGKNTVDLLEDTKQEMIKMQTNFLNAEEDLKQEIERLQIELEDKNCKIANLEEMTNILETARYDLTVENAELKAKLSDVAEYSTKIGELNKLNQTLQHRIADLEQQKYEFITDDEAQQARQSSGGDASLQAKIEELEQQNADLQKTIDEFVSDADMQRRVEQLEQTIEAQKQEMMAHAEEMATVQENLQEKTVELNVLNANFSVLQEKLKQTAPKSLFPASESEESQQEIVKLKQQLDESNKSMIKSKLKIKQLQKQIDSFKKTSNVHQEVTRLTEENQTLRQKLTEIEEEKGNLQLHLVNYDGSLPDSELEQRIKILETTCQNQTNAIQLLEEQKIEASEDLSNTRSELTTLKDQIVGGGEHNTEDEAGDHTGEQLTATISELQERCHSLEEEKKVLHDKLDHYINENIELLDKLEKLSKGSSSAESIEIVENLTHEQKKEIEEFEKSLDAKDEADAAGETEGDKKDDFNSSEIGDELNESLVKLREESAELMTKIELFTTERREVLDKLDAVKLENQQYAKQVEALEADRQALKEVNERFEQDTAKLQEMLEKAEYDKQQLQNVLKEYQDNKKKIKEVTAALKRAVSVEEVVEAASVASSTESSPAKSLPPQSSTIDRETYEKALKALDTEIQNYQKNKDKNAKLRISKKLQTEAKNTVTMMTTVMEEYWKSVDECRTLQANVEALRQTVSQQKVDDGLATRNNQLEEQLRESFQNLAKKEEKVEHLHQCIDDLENELAAQKADFDNRVSDALKELKSDLTGLLEQIASKNKEISKLSVENQRLDEDFKGATQELKKLQSGLTSRLDVSNNEVTVLKGLVSEQKAQLISTFEEHETEITEKLQLITDLEAKITNLQAELEAVRADADSGSKKYEEDMQKEVQTLQKLHAVNEAQIQQLTEDVSQKQSTIETLNQQIIDLYQQMEANSNKLIEREDEVQYLQEIIERNSSELKTFNAQQIALQREVAELEKKLTKTTSELEKAKQISLPAGDTPQTLEKLRTLEVQNHDLEHKNKEQLEKMKKIAANFKKKVAMCTELEEKVRKLEAGDKPNVELTNLQEQVAKYDTELIALRHENSRLESVKQQSVVEDRTPGLENRIQELENQLQISIATRCEIEGKLQKSETRLDDLESELVDTTNEMAHMDKKFKEDLNRAAMEANSWQTLTKEREGELVTMRGERDGAQKALAEKTAKFEKSKALIKEKMKEVQRQHLVIVDLEAKLEALNLTLANLQQQMSTSEIEKQTISEDCQKTMQLEMQIESLEQENLKLRNQIVRLEDGLATIEERRSSLEHQKNLLGAELHEKEIEFSENEDVLMHRLNALTKHDEVIERKLQETADENIQLSDELLDLKHEHGVLKNKYAGLQEEMKQLETSSATSSDLEIEISSLQKQLVTAETDLKKTKQDYEKQLATKHAEVDDLEAELSSQLQNIEDEKKVLQEDMERTAEKNTELQDEIVRLKLDVNALEQGRVEWEREKTWMRMQNDNFTHETDDLRVQMLQYQTELDDLKHTNETLQTSHEHEVNGLKQQLSDMESMNRLAQLSQHQTDDQVILQNENLKLKATLAEKEEEIRQHQAQIQQSTEIAGLNQRIYSLEHQLGHSTQEALRMQTQLQEVASESLRKDATIEEHNTHHESQIRELQTLIAVRDTELQSSQQIVVQMQEICDTKNAEIGKLRSLTHTPEPAMMIGKPVKPPTATLVQQTREDYVHDLEQRTRNLNVMHDDYLQQLQDKTRHIDELRREVRHYEERVEQLEAAKRRQSVSQDEPDEQRVVQQQVPQIASFFGAPDTSVSAFEQQLFGAPQQNPFNIWGLQPVQESQIVQKSVMASSAPKPPKDSDSKKLVDDLQNRLQALQAQHDAAVKELGERNEKINEMDKLVFDYQSKVERLEQAIETIEKIPVQEAPLVQKDTYLCYPQEHKEVQTVEVKCEKLEAENQRNQDLETQLREVIARSEQYHHELEQRNQKLDKLNKLVFEYRDRIDTLEANLAELQKTVKPSEAPTLTAFFGGPTTDFDQQIGGQSAVEPACVEKKPYLCSMDQDTQTSFEEHPVEEVFAQQVAATPVFMEAARKSDENGELQARIAELEAQLQVQTRQQVDTVRELERRNKKFEKLNKMIFDYQTKINELQESLAQQIVAHPPQTQEQIEIAATFKTAQLFDAAPSTSMFDAYENREPVVEEVIKPKDAYLCYPDGDEGWGLGSEEAILEEQHQQLSLAPVQQSRLQISPTIEAELKLREKEDRIVELEQLVAQSDHQATELSKKVEKLMKKLKEYKVKLTEYEKGFRKSSSVESNELDLAIQEELNRQVASLETKLKETKAEADKMLLEKESLNKRNEVLASANDRMTEMKERQDQQMELYQAKVRELNSKLDKLESWGDEETITKKPEPVAVLPLEAPSSQSSAELETLIRDLQVDNEEFQALLEEEKANNEILESRIRQFQATQVTMQESIDNLEEQLSKSGLARDKLVAEVEAKSQEIRDLISKIDVLSVESGKIRDTLEQLSQENHRLSIEVQELATKNSELSAEVDRVHASNKLQQQSIPAFSAAADPQKIEELEQIISSLTGQLQYKEAETAQLNQRIQEVLQADQTESLVNEILLKNQEIGTLRRQNNEMSLANVELETNLSLQLTSQMQKISDDQEASTVRKLGKQVAELQAEKAQMEQELQVLNDQVMSTLTLEDRMKEAALLVDTKNIEIVELKNSLQQLQGHTSPTPAPAQDSSVEQRWKEYYDGQLAQVNAQWSTLVESRGNEIATMWKQHLDMREAEFQQIEDALRKEIDSAQQAGPSQTTETKEKTSFTSNSELVKTMQAALESQEIEIVTLKEQLAIRSAEYARIASQLDPYGKFATSELQKKPPVETKAVHNSRAELDLAHYMLHQRDMRCEELTMELISLLEERDTLQLRLSNALRQNEEFKRRVGTYDADISESSDISKTTTPEKLLNRSAEEASSVAAETQHTTDLNYKISELQGPPQPQRATREQQLREEREMRYRQMNLLQKDLSNMPAEAVATLMASTNSPSISSTEGASSTSMLLNWFLNRTSSPQPTYTQQQQQQQPSQSATITHQPPTQDPHSKQLSHQTAPPNT